MSLSLKDHRFNRLQDCCLSLLYHIDDIAQYLAKFSSIINGITILDRSFVEMEILKPIFASISLLGIHITRPFHTLLIDPKTTWTTLQAAFKKLYHDLVTIPVDHYLTVDQVVTFVSSETYKSSLPEVCLLEKLKDMMQVYDSEIKTILILAMKMFADGFDHQRGAIFNFGPSAEKDTGTVLNISNAESAVIQKLDANVPVHNMLEERNVGIINYGLDTRGKAQLKSVSRKLLLKRSMDLIKSVDPGQFKRYKKETFAIKEIQLEWNEKMKALEKKGYSEKEALNIRTELSRLKDLECLKSLSGPFTKTEEIQFYMANQDIDDKEKNKRLYIEVRYARMASLTLKPTSAVFRSRSKGKTLSTQEYADNLSQYLDDTHNVSSLTMGDLNDVLTKLKHGQESSASISSSTSTSTMTVMSKERTDDPSQLKVGEHVAVACMEGATNAEWYLGNLFVLFTLNAPQQNYLRCI